MSVFGLLRSASFRGVPFGVLAGETKVGRRNAVHEYPYRDEPWVEDLGRASRKFSFTAFLVQDALIYGGGDVTVQRDLLLAVCEQPDSGILIHPTLGILNVSLLEPVGIREKWDKGRYFEIDFSFIESGANGLPNILDATEALVGTAAGALDAAVGADFSATIGI